ncbi:MAG TPA: hypothetical protein VIL85_19305 [Thermomicrobiales bacterium]|jgi:hypothetical protein
MRSSRLTHGRLIGTLLLTMALAGLLALANWRLPITVYDLDRNSRVLSAGAIWTAFFTHLPTAAPGILGRTPLLLGLVVAIVALAYVLVATLRLPE